jgi:superfamily II DNA/RNA helicase
LIRSDFDRSLYAHAAQLAYLRAMATFDSLGLEEGLLQSITALGFVEPTPIQEQSIPVLLKGTKDFVGLAQTGTGKTRRSAFPCCSSFPRKTNIHRP